MFNENIFMPYPTLNERLQRSPHWLHERILCFAFSQIINLIKSSCFYTSYSTIPLVDMRKNDADN